jgi:SAM-dependent methyltransferase
MPKFADFGTAAARQARRFLTRLRVGGIAGERSLELGAFRPSVPVPPGYSRAQLLEAMASASVDPAAKAEMRSYLEVDCDRFLRTLDLVPDDRDLRALEIGAAPYFTSLLLRWFRPRVVLEMTNFFDGPVERRSQPIQVARPEGSVESLVFDYWHVNVERDRVPVEDGRYDFILYCEVIEHLTMNPLASLLELKRLLRPGGQLLVTTPNVARLENVARLVVGENLYDPYSGYGPYGRHNREYSLHELVNLAAHAGFSCERAFTADVHPDRALQLVPEPTLARLVGWRASSLGQYLFAVFRNDRPAESRKPTWLYRSYPPDQLVVKSL